MEPQGSTLDSVESSTSQNVTLIENNSNQPEVVANHSAEAQILSNVTGQGSSGESPIMTEVVGDAPPDDPDNNNASSLVEFPVEENKESSTSNNLDSAGDPENVEEDNHAEGDSGNDIVGSTDVEEGMLHAQSDTEPDAASDTVAPAGTEDAERSVEEVAVEPDSSSDTAEPVSPEENESAVIDAAVVSVTSASIPVIKQVGQVAGATVKGGEVKGLDDNDNLRHGPVMTPLSPGRNPLPLDTLDMNAVLVVGDDSYLLRLLVKVLRGQGMRVNVALIAAPEKETGHLVSAAIYRSSPMRIFNQMELNGEEEAELSQLAQGVGIVILAFWDMPQVAEWGNWLLECLLVRHVDRSPHIIRITNPVTDATSKLPFLADSSKLDGILTSSTLPHTLVRAPFFYHEIFDLCTGMIQRTNGLSLAVNSNASVAIMDCDDFVKLVARLCVHTSLSTQGEVLCSGPQSLSLGKLVARLSNNLGVTVTFAGVEEDLLRTWLLREKESMSALLPGNEPFPDGPTFDWRLCSVDRIARFLERLHWCGLGYFSSVHGEEFERWMNYPAIDAPTLFTKLGSNQFRIRRNTSSSNLSSNVQALDSHDLSQPHKVGWLKKIGYKWPHSVKRRYMRLSQGILFYSADEHDETEPLGVVSVIDCKVGLDSEKGPCWFCLDAKDSRTKGKKFSNRSYHFEAESEEEAVSWREVLKLYQRLTNHREYVSFGILSEGKS